MRQLATAARASRGRARRAATFLQVLTTEDGVLDESIDLAGIFVVVVPHVRVDLVAVVIARVDAGAALMRNVNGCAYGDGHGSAR